MPCTFFQKRDEIFMNFNVRSPLKYLLTQGHFNVSFVPYCSNQPPMTYSCSCKNISSDWGDLHLFFVSLDCDKPQRCHMQTFFLFFIMKQACIFLLFIPIILSNLTLLPMKQLLVIVIGSPQGNCGSKVGEISVRFYCGISCINYLNGMCTCMMVHCGVSKWYTTPRYANAHHKYVCLMLNAMRRVGKKSKKPP